MRDLQKRIEYAQNWTRDFEEIKESNVELSVTERKAISKLVLKLQTEDDPTLSKTPSSTPPKTTA
jgi:lysyl-tRNA synthetase class I